MEMFLSILLFFLFIIFQLLKLTCTQTLWKLPHLTWGEILYDLDPHTSVTSHLTTPFLIMAFQPHCFFHCPLTFGALSFPLSFEWNSFHWCVHSSPPHFIQITAQIETLHKASLTTLQKIAISLLYSLTLIILHSTYHSQIVYYMLFVVCFLH